MSAVFEAALEYADAGLEVLPMLKGEKRPVPGFSVHDASRDPATVRGWFRRWGDSVNLAVALGNGVCALDYDSAPLEGKPLAPTVKSFRGHHVYHYGTLRNRPVRDGIDGRGPGGLLLVPPSVHPSGQPYRWTRGRALGDVPLAPLPDWVLETQNQPRPSSLVVPASGSRYGIIALRSEAVLVAEALEGERNSRLNLSAFKCGQLCAAGLLSEAATVDALTDAAAECGLGIEETAKTVASGLAAGKRYPRQVKP